MVGSVRKKMCLCSQDLVVVYRKPPESLDTQTEGNTGNNNMNDVGGIHVLVEGLVNACCFHLWVGMI